MPCKMRMTMLSIHETTTDAANRCRAGVPTRQDGTANQTLTRRVRTRAPHPPGSFDQLRLGPGPTFGRCTLGSRLLALHLQRKSHSIAPIRHRELAAAGQSSAIVPMAADSECERGRARAPFRPLSQFRLQRKSHPIPLDPTPEKPDSIAPMNDPAPNRKVVRQAGVGRVSSPAGLPLQTKRSPGAWGHPP